MTLSTFIGLACLANLSFAYEEPSRKWTQAGSGKTIEATPIDKIGDCSKIKVETEKGQIFWLVSEKLSKTDQEFIDAWFPADDYITAKVVGSGKGRKTIEFTCRAQTKAVKVTVWRYNGDSSPLVKTVPPKKELVFKAECTTEYLAQGKVGKEVVDKETDKKKTGL